MTSSQPTQPLTDEGLEELREYATSDNLDLTPQTQQRAWELLLVAYNEVDRLRTQSVRHADCNAEAWASAARVTRDLRAELDSMTQFAESLRAERDRSVRSCGELGVELDRLRAELETKSVVHQCCEEAVELKKDRAHLKDALGDANAELSRLRSENTAQGVLGEIAAERARQDAKWGPQNHPDGTGVHFTEIVDADVAKMACQDAADGGYLDWLHILREEVAEAFAESDPAALRAELVQVAAVAVAWVEAIDRRALGLDQDVEGQANG